MGAFEISSLSCVEINIFSITGIIFFGILALGFMKNIDEKTSGFLIYMGVFFNVALICDTIRYVLAENGNVSLFVICLGILYRGCLWMAAAFWFIFVVTRCWPVVRKKIPVMILMALPAVVMAVINAVGSCKKDLPTDGNLLFAKLQIYGPDVYYVLALLAALIMVMNTKDSDRKSRAIVLFLFPYPILLSNLFQSMTGKDYISLGCLASMTVLICIRLVTLGRIQRRELGHFSNIMDSLKNEYSAIIYVNIEKDTLEPYMVDKRGEMFYKEQMADCNMSQMVELYASERVYSPDQNMFRENLNLDNIGKRLEKDDVYSFTYRAKIEGEVLTYEIDVWKAKNDTDNNNFVIGFLNRTKEKEIAEITEQKELVIRGIVDGYEYVGYINYGNGSVEDYRISENFERVLEKIPGETVVDKCYTFFSQCVPKDDREEVLGKLKKNVVFDELEKNGDYDVECQLDVGEGYRYHHIRFTPDPGNPECISVGIVDIDDQMRAEIEKGERKKEKEYSIQLEATITDRTVELHEKAKSLNQLNEDIIELLGNITEARDTESGEHIRRVKGFTNILARHIMEDCPEYGLNEEKIKLITSASALHDIGKITIPDHILLKPGKFTEDEFDVMKSHCEKGCEILEKAPAGWSKDYLDFSMEICHYHHEKWDGKGYPNGLKGDEIPISAQIVAIADCFDALTSERVYKEAYSSDKAIEMILNGECGAFSDVMLNAFRESAEEFKEHVNDTSKDYSSEMSGATSVHSLSGIRLMLVEDNELTRGITKEILEEEGAIVTEATDGNAALELIKQSKSVDYDAILMDLVLPDISGFEVTATIRNMTDIERTDSVPIIAVTSSPDQENQDKAKEVGMNAFTTKPISISSLTNILLSTMRMEHDFLRKKIDAVVIQANKDPLTGVKNVIAYTQAISDITRKIDMEDGIEFAIVECDINHLKGVNDAFGHDVGDEYIRNSCKILCDVFKHSSVFRVGGDEFEVIVTGDDYINRDERMKMLRNRIEKASKISSVKEGKASFAAGIAVYEPGTDEGVANVKKRADVAMYQNKALNRYGA